jgi:hypothetical protein
MNRANGTITVTATNYKPNSRLGRGMPYGSEKRQPPVNLADRIEVEFWYSSMSANLVACVVFFLKALDEKKSGLCPRHSS